MRVLIIIIIISYACKYNYLPEFDGRMMMEAIEVVTVLDDGNNQQSLADELT